MDCTQEQLDLRARADALLMERMQAYIGVTGIVNRAEQADVPADRQNLFAARYTQVVHGQLRVPKTRWVVLRDATPAMAQMAEMSTEAFEDFYFDVCTMDYSRMEAAMAPLKALMERTDRVRILGPGTDLSFSIRGLPAVPCAGRVNIPDGEIFTAPVRESVNGTIAYNTPSRTPASPLRACASPSAMGGSSACSATTPRALSASLTRTRARAMWANSPSASIPTSPGR